MFVEVDCPGYCSPEEGLLVLVLLTDVSTPLAVVIFRVKPHFDHLTLKMTTTAKGVETSINTTKTNSPSQDYTNLVNQLLQTCNLFVIKCSSTNLTRTAQITVTCACLIKKY